jgi:hypothetical protein
MPTDVLGDPRTPGSRTHAFPHQAVGPIRLLSVLLWTAEDEISVLVVCALPTPVHQHVGERRVHRHGLLTDIGLRAAQSLGQHGAAWANLHLVKVYVFPLQA